VTITFRLSLSPTALLICADGSVVIVNVGMLEVGTVTLDGHVERLVFGVEELLVVAVVELIVVLGQH
jgi:hypothetical protein